MLKRSSSRSSRSTSGSFLPGGYGSEASFRTPSQRRDAIEMLMNSRKFSIIVGVLITMNTVLMGVELDQHAYAYTKPHDAMYDVMLGPRAVPQKVFDGFELFFLFVFGLELIGRIYVYRLQLVCEMATYVDFVALLPAIVLLIFQVKTGQQLTLLRIVRLVKLCRLLRIFRLSKELHMLAKSMASALRALVWIGLLLFITIYCSAIVCTTFIGQNSSYSENNSLIIDYEAQAGKQVDVRRYWGSMMRSMVTLFQIFTLDGWTGHVRPIVETHQPWMLIFFVSFIFTTSFGLLNLLVGTIVDRAMHIAKEHEEEKERLMHDDRRQMLLASVHLFSLMDSNGNGFVTPHEITSFLDKHDIREVLEKEMIKFNIRLDYSSLVEICRKIALDWFESSDSTPSHFDGITVEEFAGATGRLQGVAQSRDMLAVLMMAKTAVMRTEACELGLDRLQDRSERNEEKLDQVLHILQNLSQIRSVDVQSCAGTRSGECPPSEGSKDIDMSSRQSSKSSIDTSSRQSSKTSKGTRAAVLPPALLRHPLSPDPSQLQNLLASGRRATIQEDEEQLGHSEAAAEEGSVGEPTKIRRQPVTLPDLSKYSADRTKSVNPTLRMDRTIFRNAGSTQISGLLQDFQGFDDLLRTETASVMRRYSSRSVDTHLSNRNTETGGAMEHCSEGTVDAFMLSRSASSDDDAIGSTPTPSRPRGSSNSIVIKRAQSECCPKNTKRHSRFRLSLGRTKPRQTSNVDEVFNTVQVLPCAVDPMS